MSNFIKSLNRSLNKSDSNSVLTHAAKHLVEKSQQSAMALSMENITANDMVSGASNESLIDAAAEVYHNLNMSFESLAQEGLVVTEAGRLSASIATVLAGALERGRDQALKTIREPITVAAESADFAVVSGSYAGEKVDRIDLSMEAYDESSLRVTTVYSQLFNLKHGNQDKFAETWFPTVVVGPDEAGYAISINIVEVQDDMRRELTGALDQFGRKNIIHALVDPTILREDQTQLIPVVRDETKNVFVDEALVPVRTHQQDGEPVQTAPLAVGKKFSILQVSQNDAVLRTGIAGPEEAVAPGVLLDTIYVQIGSGADTEVISFKVRHLDTANFWAPPQGNYRLLQLAFSSDALQLRGEVTTIDGSASVALAGIATNNLSVRLSVGMNGSLQTELGDTILNANPIEVKSVRQGGVDLDLSDAVVAPIVQALASAKIIGYDLYGFRSNTNRRQRGQLLNNDFYTQLYPVVTRAPITIPRSQVVEGVSEATDVAALLTACGIRTTNSAIQALLEADEILHQHVNNDDDITAAPRVLGIARQAIKPFYRRVSIDVTEELMTLNSTEKSRDMQSVLTNPIRDLVFQAYTQSAYKAAADARHGGNAPKPLVIIGTDPYIANYLMLHGDLRTLGEHFDVEIVSTLNKEVSGKIFVSFGTRQALGSNQPDCFHFGNMAWKTELVYALPTHYNGNNNKQVTVQPTYAHWVNLPILIRFDVSNIPEAVQQRTPFATTTP